MILLDNNILVRIASPADKQHAVAQQAVVKLRLQNEQMILIPQTAYEFWASSTRPKTVNGMGMTPMECGAQLVSYELLFPMLNDSPNLFKEWRKLVIQYQCQGKVAHDARIVAAMNSHGITTILTFNTGDFARYPWLTVLDPALV